MPQENPPIRLTSMHTEGMPDVSTSIRGRAWIAHDTDGKIVLSNISDEEYARRQAEYTSELEDGVNRGVPRREEIGIPDFFPPEGWDGGEIEVTIEVRARKVRPDEYSESLRPVSIFGGTTRVADK